MQAAAAQANALITAGAAVWPLVAGLSVVLWSKARARQAELARARVRR